jgi:hypothetical protein
MSEEARITSRAATPATGRTPAPLLSLRADGPIVGGLSTPGEPPLLVAAALHSTDEHEQSVYYSASFSSYYWNRKAHSRSRKRMHRQMRIEG